MRQGCAVIDRNRAEIGGEGNLMGGARSQTMIKDLNSSERKLKGRASRVGGAGASPRT